MEFTRCYHCMGVTETCPCPHCGYDPATGQASDYGLRPGAILNGKYVVGTILGQGGFGITYIGWDLALESKVAIKEYYPAGQVVRDNATGSVLHWLSTPQSEAARGAGKDMFLKEARKMSRVGAIPQVVRVRDLFQQNETAYIVMDFIEGETLMARLKRNGPLSWEDAQSIFFPAIRAMEQVHQEGLIHRDLSPDNLMLLPNGDVRILDLGAAKDLNINSGASSMQVAKGGFSPLEQYTQRGGSGTWSDVYAMAATIYYSLTGVLPPNAVDRLEDDQICWDLPQLTALPPKVLAAMQQAMSVSAKARAQTMGAFLSALESGKEKKEPRKKGSAPRALLILLAVALVGFGAWKLLSPRPEEPEKTTSVPQPAATSATAPTETEETIPEETIPEETLDLSAYVGIPHFYETAYDYGVSEDTVCVYSCTFYDLENGQTKIVIDLLAPEDCVVCAEGYTYVEGSENPNVHEFTTKPGKTSGKRQRIAFDVPTEELTTNNWVAVYLGDSYEETWMQIGIYPTVRAMVASTGNPIGQVQNHEVYLITNIYQLHSLTTQDLDNDWVRFTLDITIPAETWISFDAFDTHASDRWIDLDHAVEQMPAGGRYTLVWDAPREKLVSADYIRMELYRTNDNEGNYHDIIEIPSSNWQ